MRKMALFQFFLTFLGAATAAYADCNSALTPLRLVSIIKDLKEHATSVDSSVEFAGESIKGDHGGFLSIIKRKKGMHWSSSYASTTNQNDPQSDPRSFAYVFGTRTAYFFGFREIDADTMTIPDVAEFNGALEKINRILTRQGDAPIPIQYTEVAAFQDPLPYVLNFVLENKLASAAKGHLRIHDLVHFGAIAIPPAVLEHHSLQSRRVLQFYDWLNRTIDQHPEWTWIADAKILNQMVSERGADLDVGTGNVTLIKNAADTVSSEVFSMFIGQAFYEKLLSNGRSADETLKKVALEAFNFAVHGVHGEEKLRKRDQWVSILNDFTKAFPHASFRNRLSLTGKITSATQLHFEDSDLRSILSEEAEELWRQTSRRRGKIAAAVTKIGG